MNLTWQLIIGDTSIVDPPNINPDYWQLEMGNWRIRCFYIAETELQPAMWEAYVYQYDTNATSWSQYTSFNNVGYETIKALSEKALYFYLVGYEIS
jgi:hypothetical protein